jgi:hypothetical protein
VTLPRAWPGDSELGQVRLLVVVRDHGYLADSMQRCCRGIGGAAPGCVLIADMLPDPHFGPDNRPLPQYCVAMIIGMAAAPAGQAARGCRARPRRNAAATAH